MRRAGGTRAGGYPGAAVIDRHLAEGPPRKRVGLVGVERVPVREGTALFDAAGTPAGTVCSGTLGPSVNQCVAMAYVPAALAGAGTALWAEVRGKRVPVTVSAMPFQPHRYKR